VRLVHQIVLGRHIPRLNRDCLDSWRALEEWGVDVVRWTDASARDVLERLPVDVSSLYGAARNVGERSDILRFAVAYVEGGFYVDWDVMLLDPAGFLRQMEVAERSDAMFLRDAQDHLPEGRSLDNSLFWMRRENPMALDFLRFMAASFARVPTSRTPFVTGTAALTQFVNEHRGYERSTAFFDTRQIFRFDYADVLRLTDGPAGRAKLNELLDEGGRGPGAPAVHFWTHAWVPGPTLGRRMWNVISRTFHRQEPR
jgi:hypothetical protein